jgi:hypothetical protein
MCRRRARRLSSTRMRFFGGTTSSLASRVYPRFLFCLSTTLPTIPDGAARISLRPGTTSSGRKTSSVSPASHMNCCRNPATC